ncbi:hypothetical protein LSM04_001004 [Trypanosoma melophagium]|uniref:uncharacterized protein n=1 Tax=Trypanosoma melophagium TaxID=715481 RepID=UPI003519FA48|nr:hypothetical protein LSM04_001004 [Trypanosoma melophagium]
MNSVVPLLMVPEVVAHAVDCLLMAAGRQSLDAIKNAAETITAAIVQAYYKQQPEERKEEQDINDLNIIERFQVLRSLIPMTLSHAFNILQRVHASSVFGSTERGISTTLVNLLFCTITLFRSVGCDLILQQNRQQKFAHSEINSQNKEKEEQNQLLMLLQKYSELEQELIGVLRDYFSLMVYNAEQQLWELETAAIPIESINLPVLHIVPSSTASLSSHDCWIWLLVEVTTCTVFIPNTLLLKEVGEVYWVTQVLLEMNPQDSLSTPFAQKITDIILNVYVFLLKRWMTRFPGIAEALNCWSQRDTISSLSSTVLLQEVDPKDITNSNTRSKNEENHNNNKYKDEMTVPAEVCIILYDIVYHLPIVFRNTNPMLKLLRVLSQLSVVRLFFVVHQYFGTTIAADKLSVELSLLLKTLSESLFVCTDHATCTLLPSEASVPYIQMILFNIAAYSFELQTEMSSILQAQVHMPSVTASLRYAYMLQCIGAIAEGFEGHKASRKNNNESTVTSHVDAIFAQTFVVGLEEVYSCVRALSSSVKYTASLQIFFGYSKQILRDTLEEWKITISSLPPQVEVDKFYSLLSSESLAALEHILSLYVAALSSEDSGVMPKHRCWWLLAVSYLRMADFEAQLQQVTGMSLISVEEDNDSNAFSCSTPSESVRWLYLEEHEGTTCSTWDEWMQLRSRRKGNRRIKPKPRPIASATFTLRERLISASLQFLLAALRAIIIIEVNEAKEKQQRNEVDNCYGKNHNRITAMNDETSQSTAYITAFTRFLLMMEHVQPATVVHCSEVCTRAISEWRSTLCGGTEKTYDRITEADVNAAQAYQLSVALFLR